MSQIKTLLDELKTREPEIFPDGFAKSGLTAKDITAIGKDLKIKFPASFKEFLRTYQIPSAKVYITLCGEYADAFGISFSRVENKYIDTEEDEVLVEVDWAVTMSQVLMLLLRVTTTLTTAHRLGQKQVTSSWVNSEVIRSSWMVRKILFI